MIDFLLHGENVPFTVALGLMVAIALLEGITALLGAGISNFLESLIPSGDVDLDVDVDALGGVELDGHITSLDVEVPGSPDLDAIGSPSALSRVLGWLHIGRVPVLVLLVFFLMGFGLLGFATQSFAHRFLGRYLPSLIASVPAGIGSLAFVRVVGGLLARLIPRDETEAVSGDTFIGRVATVTLGEATRGRPAEARLRDQFGKTHYVMVEPDDAGVGFPAGTRVLIIRREGARYHAIANPNECLVDQEPENNG